MLDLHFLLAERQGFEPRVPRGTTVFKTAAIDHSATSPYFLRIDLSAVLFSYSVAKIRTFFKPANFYAKKIPISRYFMPNRTFYRKFIAIEKRK